MKLSLPLLLAALVAATGCHRGTRPSSDAQRIDADTRRTLSLGPVVGIAEQSGTHAWLGIPYAQPPVGELRWRAPRPPAPWSQTLEATRFGRSCPQLPNRLANPEDAPHEGIVGDEDCLTLNVYAPSFAAAKVPKEGARLPVMVWIHGGGNSIGSSALYGGVRNFVAAHKVIVVTVNYRLGVLGWFHHPALHGPESTDEDRSGNYGTLDLIRALTFVKEEIGAFGGDPGNVTIFGESAGGINVFSLLVSPKARGLFHRAISQSGLPSSYSMAEAHNLRTEAEPGDAFSSKEILHALLARDGRGGPPLQGEAAASYLRSKTPAQLLSLMRSPGLGMYFAPFILRDGAVLPTEPFLDVLSDPKRVADVPVLLGTNRDEFKLFMAGHPAYVRLWFGLIPQIKDDGAYDRDAGYISAMWKVVGADLAAERLASALGPRVFVYRFDWDEGPKTPVVDFGKLLGAAHALEIPILFLDDGENIFSVASEENRAGREALGKAMSSYWTQFALTGAPSRGRHGDLPEWTPADPSRADTPWHMVLDSPEGGGVRMANERLTADRVLQALAEDASFTDAQERCHTFARAFGFLRSTGSWKKAELRPLTKGACDALTDRELEAVR